MVILFFVISFVVLAIGISMIYSKKRLKKIGIKTVGKVIKNQKYIETTVDAFNQFIPITAFRPIIEFTDLDNNVYQIISDEGANPPRYIEGEEVDLVYLESDPEGAIIGETLDSLELPITIIIISVILFIFTTVLIFI